MLAGAPVPLQPLVLAARVVNISAQLIVPDPALRQVRDGRRALESRPGRCPCWHKPSHYIRKGHVPSPRCPGSPGWPQLSAGRGAGRQAPRRLLPGEGRRDSSGAGRREAPGWDLQLCVWGKEKVSAEPQARGFVALLLEEGNTNK